MTTRLSFASDTHTMHGKLTQQIITAKPDVLVHCGDFTGSGKRSEVGDFADWCAMLLRKGYTQHVVAIAGNHDVLFDPTCIPFYRMADTDGPRDCRERLKAAGVVYLEDSQAEVCGLRFGGVPWTRRFFDWGFQIDNDVQDDRVFGRPELDALDVLITHGPPHRIRDLVPRGENVGSPALRRLLESSRKPKVCAFGHIHETYGMSVFGSVLCINASTCTGQYKPTNPLITVDL